MFDNPGRPGHERHHGEITVSVTGGRDGRAARSCWRASIRKPDVCGSCTPSRQRQVCSLTQSPTWTLERVATTGPFLWQCPRLLVECLEAAAGRGAGRLGSGRGGGYFLELAHTGTYYVADGSGEAVDQGQWSRHGWPPHRPSLLELTTSPRATGWTWPT